MEQNKIKKRFLLCTVLFPLLSALAAKLFYNLAAVTASDIYYTGAASVFLRAVPFLCQWSYVIFDRLFLAAGIAIIIYAVTYFGKRTAVNAIFISLGCFVASELAGLVYTALTASLSGAAAIALLISALSKLLFSAATFVSAVLAASLWLTKRHKSPKRNRAKLYSEYSAALIPSAISLLIMVLDLTVFNVIPFIVEYDNILPAEIADIILDYAYYIGIYFALSYALTCLVLLITRSVTGRLKPKKTGV